MRCSGQRRRFEVGGLITEFKATASRLARGLMPVVRGRFTVFSASLAPAHARRRSVRRSVRAPTNRPTPSLKHGRWPAESGFMRLAAVQPRNPRRTNYGGVYAVAGLGPRQDKDVDTCRWHCELTINSDSLTFFSSAPTLLYFTTMCHIMTSTSFTIKLEISDKFSPTRGKKVPIFFILL